MMSFSFWKKAFGTKKYREEHEFDEFLGYFERQDPPMRPVSNLIRFLVVGADGRKIFFDSSSYKDSQKPLPIFTFGTKQVTFADMVFGADFLNASKDMLYSTKIHDVSTYGQLLITRFVSDLDSWRARFSAVKRSLAYKRLSSSFPHMSIRPENIQNSIVACFIFNIEDMSGNAPTANDQSSDPTSTEDSRAPEPKSTASGSRRKTLVPKTLYKMFFEHCAQLSVMIEALVDSAFIAVSKTCRGLFSPSGAMSESQCADAIASAYEIFIRFFNDFYSPKLYFPVWSTLNNALTMAADSCCLIEHIANRAFNLWLDVVPPTSTNPYDDAFQMSFDVLASLFVRGCVCPLLSKGKAHRYFLGQLVTGLLILHPGWVNSLASSAASNLYYQPGPRCSPPVCIPNLMLNQLLVQLGCMETNLECLSGSVFNCTVLCGLSSKKYLLALLFFATFFLRFSCMLFTNELVPDLGRADLFELELQKRPHSRIGSKIRLKPGSVTSGDAHDSGISSQEDLSLNLFSASTGTSPTHTSSMALCMPNLLTRDQCRIAELAAQVMVNREAAAASTSRISAKSSVSSTSKSHGDTVRPLERFIFSSHAPSVNNPYSRMMEIPLLIEKSVEDTDDLCFCLPPESIPGPFPGVPLTTPQSHTSINLSKTHSDSSPALNIGTGKSSASSSPGASSPRFASSLGRNQVRPGPSNSSATSNHFDIDFRAYTRPGSPVITNHNLIGNSVTEHYRTGLALQATTESPESLRPRLLEQMNQWLKLGPLSIRGMGLSMKQTLPENCIPNWSTDEHPTLPLWSVSSMIVDTVNKTVEVLTLQQPTTRPPISPPDSPSVHPRTLPGVARHSFSQPNSCFDEPVDLLPTLADTSHCVTVKPAPLVLRMLDQILLVSERTSCPSMALRDMEGMLYVAYLKSRVLVDLLLRTGPTMLKTPERMAVAAGCTTSDLPLLLSAAASYCLPVASLLNEHHADWWFC